MTTTPVPNPSQQTKIRGLWSTKVILGTVAPTTPSKRLAPTAVHHPRTQERAVKAFLEAQYQGNQEGQCGGVLAHSRGNITLPDLRPAKSQREHAINAYIEFPAILKATREVNTNTCNKILQIFQRGNIKLLEVELDKAKAALYDNANSRVIHGKMSGQYMAAYNYTKSFVGLIESEGGDGPSNNS